VTILQGVVREDLHEKTIELSPEVSETLSVAVWGFIGGEK
jgi:hypothetical protein